MIGLFNNLVEIRLRDDPLEIDSEICFAAHKKIRPAYVFKKRFPKFKRVAVKSCLRLGFFVPSSLKHGASALCEFSDSWYFSQDGMI